MNLAQLIGAYQMRLSEYEEDKGVRHVLLPEQSKPSAPARRTRAWLQDKIIVYIEERGVPVSNIEIQDALDIGCALATVTLLNMTNARKLVRTGLRRHYRYETAPR